MESLYTKLDLYGSNIECARTDNIFSPISEVCVGTVFLEFYSHIFRIQSKQEGMQTVDNVLYMF